MGIKNGTLGTVEKINKHEINVRLDRKDEKGVNEDISFNASFYNYIDHGYAATVHKAQAVTVDRTYVLGSKYFDRHAVYVAMTGHRQSADFFYSQEKFESKKHMIKSLSRKNAKDITLDYKSQKLRFDNWRGLIFGNECQSLNRENLLVKSTLKDFNRNLT